MFPCYTDNAAVRAWAAADAAMQKAVNQPQEAVGCSDRGMRRLPKNPDPCSIDTVIFKDDDVPPPAYWHTAAEMLDADTPTRRAVRAVAAHISSAACTPHKADAVARPEADPTERVLDLNPAAVDANAAANSSPSASVSHSSAVGGSQPDSPIRHRPGTSHGGPAVNGADPRSQLYREGRAEIVRQRQLQQQQREASQSPPHADLGVPTEAPRVGLNGSNTSSKYSQQADAEMLKHWMGRVSAERARTEEALASVKRLEAELTLERGRRAEVEEEKSLLQTELRTTRERSHSTIEVAQRLEREKAALIFEKSELEEANKVLERDYNHAVKRIQQLHSSLGEQRSASQTSSPAPPGSPVATTQGSNCKADAQLIESLKKKLDAARDEVDSVKKRQGEVGVELVKERNANLRLKQEHKREVERLNREVGMVKDSLRSALARGDEVTKTLRLTEHETMLLVRQLEERLTASRQMAASVVEEDESSARRRVQQHECAVRVQLGALHATVRSGIV
jgi:hypothetical protein